jgi:putative chitinase
LTAIRWDKVQAKVGARVDGSPGRETWGKVLAFIVRRPVDANIERMAQGLAKYAPLYSFASVERVGETLAELAHETGNFKKWEENLSYSARGLADTWPTRYSTTGKKGGKPNQRAEDLARRPEAIANDTYALRMGNQTAANDNDVHPDGWQYRGRGPTMLTGKSNYAEFGPFVGLDLVKFPDLAADPFEGVHIALEFYQRKGVFTAADAGNWALSRQRVNGGNLGLAAVAELREPLLELLAA